MIGRLWMLVGFLAVSIGFVSQADADIYSGEPAAAAEPVVYLDVQASTWRPRGRISFGIEPVLRMKLVSAGFGVTQDPGSRHDLIIRVEYREDRGEPIAVNLYGTDITCRILLDRPQPDQAQFISIHESPSYTDLVNAPYVEVVEKLETNPYFYFLGHIVRGWHEKMDTTGALIQALDRQFNEELHRPPATPMDTLVSPAETFPDLEAHFAPTARENTVDELGRLGDTRAIELLERLMTEADRSTRLRAVVAMGQFDAPSVLPALSRVVETDSDKVVRTAASGQLLKRSRR
jgi:HEAT repeats